MMEHKWQLLTATVLAFVCVALSVSAVISGKANQNLQAEVQAQQTEINKGTMGQQIGTNLLRDIAVAAAKDNQLRDLLTRNGFTLTENASPTPSPAP